MVDTVGEISSGYNAVDSEAQKALDAKKLSVQKPSRGWQIAHRLGIASLVASLGIAGGSVVKDQTPLQTVQGVGSVASGIAEKGTNNAVDTADRFRDNWQNGTPDQRDPRNK